MGIGEPKMPTPEEMAKMQKERILSDAELVKEGASVTPERVITSASDEQIDTAEQEEIKKKEDQDILNQLGSRLKKDLEKIDNRDESIHSMDPEYVKEIALNITSAIEKIREKDISDEVKDAYGRVHYLNDNESLPDDTMNIELSKTFSSLEKELQKSPEENNEIENEKIKIIKKIIEGMKSEFDLENPEKNHRIGMVNVAHKVFIDISNIRDLYLSKNQKGILGRGTYLNEKRNSLSIDDVTLELQKILDDLEK